MMSISRQLLMVLLVTALLCSALTATASIHAAVAEVARCQLLVQRDELTSRISRVALQCSGAPVTVTLAKALNNFKNQFLGVTVDQSSSTSGCLLTLSKQSHVIFTRVEAAKLDPSNVICLSEKSTATFLRLSRPMLQQRLRASELPALPSSGPQANTW